jgi:hypothetical protein
VDYRLRCALPLRAQRFDHLEIESDILITKHRRFTSQSGSRTIASRGPLCANSGHFGTSINVRFTSEKRTFCAAARKFFAYTKALSPVIALPTINVFISRVPS